MEENGMRELSPHEASMVSAGEVTCTVGVEPVPCPGSANQSHAAEWLIGAVTDLIEKLADWWTS
jgi:hypothetical protein